MTSDGERLFVYGTLRPGSGHRMLSVLEGGATFIDEATFQGRLYRVAHYPGAVASGDPSDHVIGVLFRLLEPRRLLMRLDRYEGCDPRNPRAPFVRTICRLALRSGETIAAWVYLYRLDTANLERIESGDFFASDPAATPNYRRPHRQTGGFG